MTRCIATLPWIGGQSSAKIENVMATIKSFTMTFQALARCQLQNSLWWPVYVINSFDNTKLPCYTPQPMQHQFL